MKARPGGEEVTARSWAPVVEADQEHAHAEKEADMSDLKGAQHRPRLPQQVESGARRRGARSSVLALCNSYGRPPGPGLAEADVCKFAAFTSARRNGSLVARRGRARYRAQSGRSDTIG